MFSPTHRAIFLNGSFPLREFCSKGILFTYFFVFYFKQLNWSDPHSNIKFIACNAKKEHFFVDERVLLIDIGRPYKG
jgi:hypothetical protein